MTGRCKYTAELICPESKEHSSQGICISMLGLRIRRLERRLTAASIRVSYNRASLQSLRVLLGCSYWNRCLSMRLRLAYKQAPEYVFIYGKKTLLRTRVSPAPSLARRAMYFSTYEQCACQVWYSLHQHDHHLHAYENKNQDSL